MGNKEALQLAINSIEHEYVADLKAIAKAIKLSRQVGTDHSTGAIEDARSCIESAIAHLRNANNHLSE